MGLCWLASPLRPSAHLTGIGASRRQGSLCSSMRSLRASGLHVAETCHDVLCSARVLDEGAWFSRHGVLGLLPGLGSQCVP